MNTSYFLNSEKFTEEVEFSTFLNKLKIGKIISSNLISFFINTNYFL
jgi:hypothetical protein